MREENDTIHTKVYDRKTSQNSPVAYHLGDKHKCAGALENTVFF